MMDWAGMMSDRWPHRAGPGAYGGFAVDREKAYDKLPYIDFDQSRNFKPNAWWRKWIQQNTANGEYWRAIAYQTPESYARVKVPSLAITGWFDADFPGTPMNYLAMMKYPYYLRNPNSGEHNIGLAKELQTARQTIFHDAKRPSHVVLPVIPADSGNQSGAKTSLSP